MHTVITVLGKDMMGILARVSAIRAENRVNMVEVAQSVLQDMFAMIMMVDVSESIIPFSDLADRLTELGTSTNLAIHTTHEGIFDSMHRI